MDRARAWPWVRIVAASAAALVWGVLVVTRWQGEACGRQRLVNSLFAFALGLPAVVAVWVLARRLAHGARIFAAIGAVVLALVPTVVAVVRLIAVVRVPAHLCPQAADPKSDQPGDRGPLRERRVWRRGAEAR